jgi:hypothetical protein
MECCFQLLSRGCSWNAQQPIKVFLRSAIPGVDLKHMAHSRNIEPWKMIPRYIVVDRSIDPASIYLGRHLVPSTSGETKIAKLEQFKSAYRA